MSLNSLDRRDFLSLAGLGLAGTLVSCGKKTADQNDLQSAVATKQPSKPNILLLIADDTGWHDVGYHDSVISTPNIDSLAAEGSVLERFYACPTCSPTRAAVLTGRPPTRFGIYTPIAMRSELCLPKDQPTLPALLQAAGYSTHQIGKWHLGLRPEVGPNQYGFQTSYGYLHGQIDQYTHIYKNGDQSWHRNGQFIEEEGHATDLIGAETRRLIKERDKDQPFFIYTAFSVPHYPIQEPDEWLKPYEDKIENKSRRLYAASMTHMDYALGQIIATLKEEGIERETLVIFMSDNGGQENWFPTHGEYNLRHGPYDVLGNNEPLRDWKGSVYEGGIRVPAVVRQPGTVKQQKVNQVCHAMDILPTVLKAAGIALPAGYPCEGISINAWLTGNAPDKERTLYWNTSENSGILDGHWKLVHSSGTLESGTDELYDVFSDPCETNDLSAANPEKVKELLQILSSQLAMDNI